MARKLETETLVMCGLTGFLAAGENSSYAEMEQSLLSMRTSLLHRGPDDAGLWADTNSGIWMGHQRLAIVDLTRTGLQPMKSASGRYIIVFNGEIYNHMMLRQMLENSGKNPNWHGHSDTESLIAGFDAWGIRETIEKTIGMFAFAVWDRRTSSLTLGRDRIGEKPLYYGWQGQGKSAVFLFGSELKALRAHPAFEGKISRNAISLQMRYKYIPAPYSIYEGIKKLLPGSLLTVSLQQREPEVSTFWSSVEVAIGGMENRFLGDYKQAIDEMELLLKDAICNQMTAEVPLGAFLSGGIDSSTVVALMQAQSSRPIKTFTIGFNEEGYDEAVNSKAVARHLGTEHTELYVEAEQARSVIPLLSSLYDEPFSDSSQIPTFLVSKLAQQHVKISLSGDGGDELFCGYNRYLLTRKLGQMLANIPMPLRKFAGLGLTSVSAEKWNMLGNALARIFPQSLKFPQLGDKLQKLAEVLANQSYNDLYLMLVSDWKNPASIVIGGEELPFLSTSDLKTLKSLVDVERMMVMDTLTYLPNDILTKIDRAAMGVSLETRVPFLDHRVVEFAWRLPLSMKLNRGQTKWILRQVLNRHVPSNLTERPKMGFGVPIDSWLRGPLREWADDLLDETRLKHEGFFYTTLIRQKWSEHLSGLRNWQYQLWNILMFQSWLGENK